ncbi:unnamed protein product [Leptidea sinapis]|uniref:Uncharacterized protein n=1 Tax=Leptidea sinapis TaxID=189913 RepID=A0A5E4R6D9_9NEOP|nr:unnamed protein product [Leptidea sinapis]
MERLIEKMMVDLDADSDDSNSYALTNATSARSSGTESDHEGNVTRINTTAMNTLNKTITNITNKDEIHTSTPHKSHSHLGDELSAIADPSYDTKSRSRAHPLITLCHDGCWCCAHFKTQSS